MPQDHDRNSPRPTVDQSYSYAHDMTEEGAMSPSKARMDAAPSQVHTSPPPPFSTSLDAFYVSSSFLSNIDKTDHASPARVTPPDLSHIPAGASNEGDDQNQVAPPNSVVRPGSCDLKTLQSPTSINSAPTILKTEVQSAPHSQEPRASNHNLLPALHQSLDRPAHSLESAHGEEMIFGTHSTAQAAQRRRNYASTNALTDFEADMTSKDRAKQKEAVKRYLTERVKQDWTWEWPRPEPGSTETAQEVTPNVDRTFTGEERWKERDEWLSNASDDEDRVGMPTSISSPDTPSTRHSPYRFESPGGVGDSIKRTHWERKQRRKKRLAEELKWNNGLRCFIFRRDAWTGARKVSRSSLGFAPVRTAQRSSVSSGDGGSSTAVEREEEGDDWEDDIEIPIAPPILPPENQMRASILPTAYSTIYDKVVIQSLQPSCPMNLKDVTRSCVQGWKRDGEWPPKSSVQEPKKKGRKMSVASLFGLDKREDAIPKDDEKEKEAVEKEKKPLTSSGIKKSIQRILSLGQNAKDKDSGHGTGRLTKGTVMLPSAGA